MKHALYRETILSHYRTPSHRYAMDETPLRKEGRNPVCGDEITVYGRIESDKLAELSFEGHGCSISIAAADMLCGALTGRAVEEGREIIEHYLRLVEEGSGETFAEDLEELNAMEAVRAYPSRIDCAALAWRTAQEVFGNERKIEHEGD